MIQIFEVFLLSYNLLIDLLLEKLALTTYFSKEKHSFTHWNQTRQTDHGPCHHIDVKSLRSLGLSLGLELSILQSSG